MKSITGFALGLAALVAVPMAMADDDTTMSKSTTTTTSSGDSTMTGTKTETETSTETEGSTTKTKESTITTAPATPYAYGGGPVTTTTSTTTSDYYVHDPKKDDEGRHVRSGLGLNVFGTAGAADQARWGVGGRIEYVTRIGLTLGGSYTQHFTSERDRTAVRPLLGEIGWAIPVVNHLEIRPMVGLGYAFASATTDTDTNNTGTSNQVATTSGTASAAGFDVAPGAKVSYVARMFELYTMPKYHFISGNNFAGIELGAGARF